MKPQTTLLIALSLLYFSCQKKQEETKVLGPYLQKMSYDEVTINWSTYEGKTIINNGEEEEIINNYQQHETILTRLKPKTTYTYDVLNDGTDRGKGSFTTFPKEIEPFHFVVLGDTRTRHDVHQKVVDEIIKEDPLFVVNSGDLVSRGNSMPNWEKFFSITDSLINNVPYFTVLGNHEQDSPNYYDFFSVPSKESYYFFSVGDALFIVMDMEGPDYNAPAYLKGEARDDFWYNISKDYFEREKAWLENLLTLNKDAGYIFVFFHPTFYSIKESRVEEAEIRRAFWGDIFERHGVTAIINGHDHHYHHAEHGGTHYITSAGGGAPLYETNAIQPETVHYKKIEHFMRIDVGEKEAVIKAIQLNGEIIEEIVANKRN